MTMSNGEREACLCGCGDTPSMASSRYLPGHDRRHIEQLVVNVRAGGSEDDARAELTTPEARGEFDRRLSGRA